MIPENLNTGNFDDKWQGEVQDVANHPARNIPDVTEKVLGLSCDLGPKRS